jgi:hypothetical protein
MEPEICDPALYDEVCVEIDHEKSVLVVRIILTVVIKTGFVNLLLLLDFSC